MHDQFLMVYCQKSHQTVKIHSCFSAHIAYVPIEWITVTIYRKPPDDFVEVGKLSEQIRAR